MTSGTLGTVVRIGWVLYGLFLLLMAVGAFGYSLWAALALWGAVAGAGAFLLARWLPGVYVAAGLAILAPLLVNLSVPHAFGLGWVVGNTVVAAVLAMVARWAELKRREELD